MTNRAARNPTRRNRNIGTSASGRGQDNRLTIPSKFNGPIWHWRDIGEYRVAQRNVHDRDVLFVVERTNRGCIHACTVDDIARLLKILPCEDWEGLTLFVLRQPKRKEAILNGVWGRLAYGGEIGRPQDGMFSGPAVFLEATPPDLRFNMNVSMGPAARSEFERLCRDGHAVSREGSRFVFDCSLESIRNTQLYRTVIHEIGHWVDWLNRVKRPAPPDARLDDYDWRRELQESYDRRSQQEREAAANQYAERMWTRLHQLGVIPFDRILRFDDLDSRDFVLD